MNKKEFIEKLINMGGCDAKPKSWARGWDDAISDVVRLAEELDEPKKPVVPKFMIKRGPETGGISVVELNRITSAKAHGYDEVPEVETDTTHTNTNKDMVNQPNHYIGEYGLEVEDVLRNFIPRYTDPYVGHRIASAIEYLLRSPLKNQRQDIEKAGKNIQQALAYLDMTEEEK